MLKNNSSLGFKYNTTKVLLGFVIALFFISSSYSQTIPSSGTNPTNCASCTPTGWSILQGGTPDISNRTSAAGSGTTGGGATWTKQLPLPPTGDLTWITMRDFGGTGVAEESISTTMGGLIQGKIYRLTLYALTAITNADGQGDTPYAGTYKDVFDYQIDANGVKSITNIGMETWNANYIYFIGNPDSNGNMTLTLYPGEYSSFVLATPDDQTIQSVHITVQLNDLELLDTDGDGISDLDDIDDDNDGILDTVETFINGVQYDPLGDEDNDKLLNYLDAIDDNGATNADGSVTDYTATGNGGIPDVFDFDDDGIANHIDLDADGDGIPDNIEAQTTTGYIAPNPDTVGTYSSNNGLNSAYIQQSFRLTPVNTDETDNPDYLDLNSDNDNGSDTIEANIILSGVIGNNGLDAKYSNGDNYTDVNGLFDNTQTDNFPNDGNDDVDWRDINVEILIIDTDGDGIANDIDVDNDNDGILDTDEVECETIVDNIPAGFGSAPGTDLSNSGTFTKLISSQSIIVDLGAIRPEGNTISVVAARERNNDIQMTISSTNIDGTADTNSSASTPVPAIAPNTNTINYTIGQGGTRYLKIQRTGNGGTQTNRGLFIYTVGYSSYTVTTNSCSDYLTSDSDGDGIPNYLDLDSDNDGIPDNIEAQFTTSYIAPNGVYNASGEDTAYVGGLSPVNTDSDVKADYIDTDSDNDGILDRTEAGLSLTGFVGVNGLDSNYDNGDNYVDTNGNFNSIPYSNFPISGGGVQVDWRNAAVQYIDNDTDGVVDTVDLDDDNDGILDTVEAGGYDPSADADGDGIPNYKDIDFATGVTGDTLNSFGVWTSIDPDGDGFANHLDLDSDNDGIPDNIEAQNTTGYDIPDGLYDPATGVDTSYTGGLSTIDTDGDSLPDYLDTDADDDGILDNVEAGLTLTGKYGNNGLDNAIDNGDNYIDVNGIFDNSQQDNFPDEDGDALSGGDVDFRDITFSVDNDGDGIFDDIDLDDDNDGISDFTEFGAGGNCQTVGSINFDAEYDPNNTGTTAASSGLDPIETNNTLSSQNVGIKLSRTSNVFSSSNYRVNDHVTTQSAYTLSQLGTNGGNSRHTFTFDAPVFGLAFSIYDVNIDSGTATDQVEILLTKEDGSNYVLTTSDYTTGSSNEALQGSNTFRGIATDATGTNAQVSITIPVWVTKIQIVYTNAGTGNLTGLQEIAIGNFQFCAPLDTDGDTIFDYRDLDSDNDGIPDNIEAQSTLGYIAPSYSYNSSGIDLAYGSGLVPVNTSISTGTEADAPDYIQLDSDNDGTNDIDESGSNLANTVIAGRTDGAVGSNGLDNTLESADNYSDVNGSFDDTQADNFTDSDSDVNNGGDLDYRDSVVGVDTDGDGIANTTDIDNDNDGIPDTVENGGNDPNGDEDNDGILNYLDTTDNGDGGPGGTTDYTDNDSNGIPDVYDFDGDGVLNQFDIDADNDGIPDNIEAQTTLGYVAPSGIDTDSDGLDDAYDTDCAPCGDITGVDLSSPNNDNNSGQPDYLDTDSDGDGTPDIQENGDADNTVSGTDTDGDGLDDNFEGSNVNDGYDVNNDINTPSTDLPDADSDVNAGIDGNSDVDYRDAVTGVVNVSAAGALLWLRADLGASVSLWEDQSGANHNATPGTNGPVLNSGAVNFNPAFGFNGTTQYLEIINAAGNGIFETGTTYADLATYAVVLTSSIKDSYIFKEETTARDDFLLSVPKVDGLIHYGIDGGSSDINHPWVTNTSTFDLYNFYGTDDATAAALTDSQQALYLNGVVVDRDLTTNYAGNTIEGSNTENFYIGAGTANNGSVADFHNGQIAEIIVFSGNQTSITQQSYQSYLAIKYGITLNNVTAVVDDTKITEGDYILSDKLTKVWDYSANSAYHNDVSGIGRDDGLALGQYQSKSVNSDAIITIGLTAIATSNQENPNYPTATITASNPPGAGFSTNKDFMMWGNNNGGLDAGSVIETALICAPEKTLARSWKVVENGNVGEVKVAVNKQIIDAALSTPNTLKVFKIADDAAFTTNVDYVVMEDVNNQTINNEVNYTLNYNFTGTKYFTFSEINGIFWDGDSQRWFGGNSTATNGGPSINTNDRDKVLVIDDKTGTNAFLNEPAVVECVWIKQNSKLVLQDTDTTDDNEPYLEFDEDFKLDGELRLTGNTQLVQTHPGASNVQGTGLIYRDRQGSIEDVYRYHYWSSPVREINKATYRLKEVMKDGSIATSANSTALDINWISLDQAGETARGLNGDYTTTPIKIANYWIYTFANGTDDQSYLQAKETGTIPVGQGFTMKSSGKPGGQNFTFVGFPNDGTINISLDSDATDIGSIEIATSTLLGNPYPSALDNNKFLLDNQGVIDGTLYFWEHTGEDNSDPNDPLAGHFAEGYQGGYGTYNLSMGLAANQQGTVNRVQYTWDENATDNGDNITETISYTDNGTTTNIKATVEASIGAGGVRLQNMNGKSGTSGNVIFKENGSSLDSITVRFDDKVDIYSIKVYNDGGTNSSVPIFIRPNNPQQNASLNPTLINEDGQTLIANWTDIQSFTISSAGIPTNIGLDDIVFSLGDGVSLGTGEYTAPSRFMAVGQGFFVNSDADGGTLRFDNSQRVYRNNNYDTGGTYFFRGGNNKKQEEEFQDNLPIIKLGLSYLNSLNQPIHRQIGISFKALNSYAYDYGFDSEMFDISETDIYWSFPEMDNKRLVIAGVRNITNNLEVPLTVVVKDNDVITFEIDEIKNIINDVFLTDKVTGISYNLNEKVNLSLPNGTYSDRFYISFSQIALSLEDEILNTNIFTFIDNSANEVVLRNLENVQVNNISLYNMLGQKVRNFNKISNARETRLPLNKLPTGIYILNIETERGKVSKKVLID